MMCLLGFGSYFCFDNPGALQTDIKVAMNMTTAQFANLYSWYSWPNVVLPVVGGFLMDRVLGIRFGTMVFAFIICIGQAIFSLGGFLDRLWVMEIGRWKKKSLVSISLHSFNLLGLSLGLGGSRWL